VVYNPKNRVESAVSVGMRAVHPYLNYITYRFHVEKCRESGMRIEDFYHNKFFKEPMVQFHLYAQYFHPETLLERVRDVRFHRNPRTIFKGFTVPDWATSKERHGWESDHYSRSAWDNAMDDLDAETTPLHFHGERLEPNVLQWFRFEDVGRGMSTRLFYNEVPAGGNWFRNRCWNPSEDMDLYSFKEANQTKPAIFGMDTTTPEGREAFLSEHLNMCEMNPELISKENMIYPHEQGKWVSQEPHFQRAW